MWARNVVSFVTHIGIHDGAICVQYSTTICIIYLVNVVVESKEWK